ncbi:MAG: flavodoxin [Firmicutes bacterium HGW-Firmicutes-19]|jgi:NAD(P)H dehydrogenase (quinone)|nr:MAG: flavodoxin [Firmicutes bacterium HGW-Firmicutes-19]
MKIAVVIYSYTGNSFSIGQKIVRYLQNKNQDAHLIRVDVADDQPSKTDIQLGEIESIASFDRVIFGSPVRAFSLAPAMVKYLQQVESLKGKTVSCFVTKQLPFLWTGGTSALNKMVSLCKEKGALIDKTVIINWSYKDRDQKVDDFIKSL